MLRLIHHRGLWLLALLLLFDILHEVLFRWKGRHEHEIGGAGEVGHVEGIGEEVANVGIHDGLLRLAIVAEEDRVEVAAVLLRHPVEALALEEDVGGFGGDWGRRSAENEIKRDFRDGGT